MRRVGTPPRYRDLDSKNPHVEEWFQTVGERMNIYTSPVAPTVNDIPDGQWALWKNTPGGSLALYANYGGTLVSTTLGGVYTGTWTVTAIGDTVAGTSTYTSQSGRYQVVGNRCTFNARVAWSNFTGTGGIRISLPFTANASAENNAFALALSNLSWTAGSTPMAYVSPSENYAVLRQAAPGGGITNIPPDTAATVIVTGTYEIA